MKPKLALFAIAAAMGMSMDTNNVFAEPRKSVHSARPQGRKCGECCSFGKPTCKCKLTKATSPACSQFKIEY